MRFALALLWAAIPTIAATCESLASLSLPHTAITAAAVVPAGSFTPPGGRGIDNLPAFCRVAGSIRPSSDSDIQFEVWLPASGWNGKFQGVGNGGFAGSINHMALAAVLRNGYASASTDTGHGVWTEAEWALGHPEKVIDFGHRAIHETAVAAKAVIAAFYGSRPKRSYFNGCSNGGRQALMEAQRYPDDYDGIIAGAPANYWTRLVSNSLWVVNAMSDPGAHISAAKLASIEEAALAACDAKDGIKDGVIDRPDQCEFRPASLLCKGPETAACLTKAQVAALEKILGGMRGANGRQLHPGYVPGGMTGPGAWTQWITGPTPTGSLAYAFGNAFFRSFVHEDRAWNYRTFDPDRDTSKADDKLAMALNATDSDLAKFRARSGKLVLYHGWSDAAITPLNSIDYYGRIKNPGGFVRLFMAPGMAHCGGGPGPYDFGQAPGITGDPLNDLDAALERWVEQGTPPDRIVARREGRTRPLCAWPKAAVYKGSGSTDEAANFECR